MCPDLNEATLRAHFSAALGVPVLLAVQTPDDELAELTPAELEQLAGMSAISRTHDYRLGRAALKRLLAEQGRNTDTTRLQWPDARCSLSHSGGYAIAAGLHGTEGIGVDLQLIKRPQTTVAERILSNETLIYWLQLPEAEQTEALLRYWTVNEAIYKACPGPQPAYFRHYRLTQPERLTGTAVIDGTPYQFRVASLPLADGCLSVAVRLPVALGA
jgi:4'-phosphopantetheinyl transferase EntD